MSESRYWLAYFRSNQADPDEIPWDATAPPDAALRAVLVPSLQQFQLGENAAGTHFLELARRHAQSANDPDFTEAIALFIAEEQRHSRLLALYLSRISAPLLTRHWIHSIFRHIRHWVALEGKVSVLVTAEVMAIPYYRAVMNASRCPALAAICRRILREEVRHLQFQGNTLRTLRKNRSNWSLALTHALHKTFLAGTCLSTWFEHRHIFRLAGQRFPDVWHSTKTAFALVHRKSPNAVTPTPSHRTNIPSSI